LLLRLVLLGLLLVALPLTVLLLLLVVSTLALPIDTAVTLLRLLLAILPESLLSAVLRVVPLAAVVLLLLVLPITTTPAKPLGLARLKGLGRRLERSGTDPEASLSLLGANIHLLGLAGQVLILSSRVVLP